MSVVVMAVMVMMVAVTLASGHELDGFSNERKVFELHVRSGF